MEWIKLSTGIFQDEKIRMLNMYKNTDELVCIWLKILCLAGRTDNGGVFVMETGVPYTADHLAVLFEKKKTVIRDALNIFVTLGMVEIVDGIVTLPNWEKHQQTDKYEQYKQRHRDRQKSYRERQRDITRDVTRDVTVTGAKRHCDAVDKDKEEDKDIYTIGVGVGDINTIGYSGLPPADNINAYVTNAMPMSPTYMQEFEEFKGKLPEDVIRWCIDQSVESRNWKYCRKVLMRCVEEGYKTLGEVLAAQKRRDEQKRYSGGGSSGKVDMNYQQHPVEDRSTFNDDYYSDPAELMKGMM